MENKNVSYILDNVVRKARYNEETKKYEIKESDYLYLELTSKQKRLLKKICDKFGIDLEYTSYTKDLLPAVEDGKLFEEYNEILDKLENVSEEEKEALEARRIELRNKIWTDNIELANSIVSRRINKEYNAKMFKMYEKGFVPPKPKGVE